MKNKVESKPIYSFIDGEEFSGIMWDTPLGKIVTTNGKLNPDMNLLIKDCNTNEDVADIDLRTVLLDILPR